MTSSGLLVFAAVLLAGCTVSGRIRRPDIAPVRMLEPSILEPAISSVPGGARTGGDLGRVRLLETHARAHIGRTLLHREANGELVADPLWRWSSAPDRYLDSVLRITLAGHSDLQLVDASDAATIGPTLLEWNLEKSNGLALVGAVEVTTIGMDRRVHVAIIRAREAVSGVLPGDIAAASGRLLNHLAADTMAHARTVLIPAN